MREWLTVLQLAEYLQVHKNTIYQWARENKIPHYRIEGDRIRFKKSEIDEWVKKGASSPPISEVSATDIKKLDGSDGHVTVPLKGDNGLKKISKTRWRCAYGCIYIRKTKQGLIRFYADYRDRDGNRKQPLLKHAQTPMEAFRDLKALVRIMYEPAQTQDAPSEVKFRDFAFMYLDDYARVKKRSWKTDKSYLDANLVPYFGDYSLAEITSHMVEKYQGKRLNDGVAKSTVNRELACMKKLYNKAIQWNKATVNPVLEVGFFSEANNLKERVLSFDEEKRLLEACSEQLKPIVITALQTGVRRREILLMKWENVNLDNEILLVPRETSKSGKDRFIKFNGMLKTELFKIKSMNGTSPYVFVNPKTGKPFVDIKKSFRAACEESDNLGLRFHDLRHTYASRLAESNVQPKTIQELLGHSKLAMTERYIHTSEEQKKKAVDLLHQWYMSQSNSPS